MATAQKPAVAQNGNDNKGNVTSNAPVDTTVTPKKITFDGKEYTEDELTALLKSLDEQKKAIKAAAKGETVKPTKENKGVKVAFRNKAGEQIIGDGVMYYVARANGKLHYKEASQVSFLPKDWKDGDPIPAAGSEESAKNLAAYAPKIAEKA